MFTGIVQHLASVHEIQRVEFGASLIINAEGWDHRPGPGDSIAVNGCCLTATSPPDDAPDGHFRFDVIQQTLSVTTLGGLRPGDPVNLEHAVTTNTMLGGHIVQGHVDGIATVIDVIRNDEECRVRVEAPAEQMDAIVDKGSVALDGVSLTVAELDLAWFEVALIPTTLDITTLGRIGAGSKMNLETDYIAKTVVNWLQRQSADTALIARTR